MERSGISAPMRVTAAVVVIGGVVALGVVLVSQRITPTPPNTPSSSATSEQEPARTNQTRQPFEPGMLLVGDPAPAISASRWFLGAPTDQLEPGRVYVVDLWATWCGPCVKAMPHLTRLQKRYVDQGLRVIAVSVDQGTGAQEQVKRFIERHADDIGFDVALDDGGTTAAWLDASGRTSIPSSYVVDREGTVVWIGNPLASEDGSNEPTLDRVLRDVFNSTYDLESATRLAHDTARAARRARQQQEQLQELTDQMNAFWGADKINDALAAIDTIVELDPAGSRGLAVRKAEILLAEQNKPDEASAFFARLIEGPYFDDNDTLLRLANLFAGDLDPGETGREAAITAASLAVSRNSSDPDAILILAKAQAAAKMPKEAVQTAAWARDLHAPGTQEHEFYDQYVAAYKQELAESE